MRALASLLLGVATVVASCGGGVGPGGAPTTYHRCTPYNGTMLCKGVQFPNFYQCDEQPGARCVSAPRPSPDPKQTVWCCEFTCVRGDPAQDFRCKDGRAIFYCNSDANVDAKAIGCVPGSSSAEICC